MLSHSWTFLRWGCLSFVIFTKKQGRSSSNSGYEIQKICGWKIYSRTRTFGAEVHKSNIRVKRWHNKYENSELYWKTQLLLKWFAYQVQSYWNTDLWSRGTNFLGHPVVAEKVACLTTCHNMTCWSRRKLFKVTSLTRVPHWPEPELFDISCT